jgi:hypothetical protein
MVPSDKLHGLAKYCRKLFVCSANKAVRPESVLAIAWIFANAGSVGVGGGWSLLGTALFSVSPMLH